MNLFSRHAKLFFTGFVRFNLFGGEASTKEELEPIKEEFAKGIDTLTKFLAHSGGPYLAGSTLTAGDLTSFSYLFNTVHLGLFSLEKHPEVQAWFDLVSQEKGAVRITKEAIAQFSEISK